MRRLTALEASERWPEAIVLAYHAEFSLLDDVRYWCKGPTPDQVRYLTLVWGRGRSPSGTLYVSAGQKSGAVAPRWWRWDGLIWVSSAHPLESW